MKKAPISGGLSRKLIGPIIVALLLASGFNAFVLGVEPAVSAVLSLLINRIISQAHLDAAPLPTKVLWGDSIVLCAGSLIFLWLGYVLAQLLFSNKHEEGLGRRDPGQADAPRS